jgi:hypothetical protein
MNRADFVAADGQSWWLCETQIDSQTDEARRELGVALGFNETEWFVDPNRRTVLFDLLESNGSPLLNDLDYLSEDVAKLQWVQGAAHLAAPPPAPLAPGPAPAVSAAPTQDDTTDAAPLAPADTPPAAPLPAPVKKSIFKSKAVADGAGPAPTADGAPNEAAATNGTSDSNAGDSNAGDSNASGPAEAPQLDQAVQTVLADVTGGGLAGLAQDLGVEADELGAIVNHPDFEREVREEVARITAG